MMATPRKTVSSWAIRFRLLDGSRIFMLRNLKASRSLEEGPKPYFLPVKTKSRYIWILVRKTRRLKELLENS